MTQAPHPHDVRSLFDAVIELPTRERGRYLDVHCTDIELRRYVERLVEADEGVRQEQSVNARRLPNGIHAPTECRAEFPAVKGYEIVGQLGEGGMGLVYKARQVGLNRLV